MKAPAFKVVRLHDKTRTGQSIEFEVRGGTIREDWARRCQIDPWCRFAIFVTGDPRTDHVLTSYGGEVWPSAWPAFFEGHGRENGAGMALTTKGQEAVRLALIDHLAFGVTA